MTPIPDLDKLTLENLPFQACSDWLKEQIRQLIEERDIWIDRATINGKKAFEWRDRTETAELSLRAIEEGSAEWEYEARTAQREVKELRSEIEAFKAEGCLAYRDLHHRLLRAEDFKKKNIAKHLMKPEKAML